MPWFSCSLCVPTKAAHGAGDRAVNIIACMEYSLRGNDIVLTVSKNSMKKEVEDAMNKAHEARAKFKVGKITHEQAAAQIQPYLDLVNEGGKIMSKQFGNSFRKVTMTGFLR